VSKQSGPIVFAATAEMAKSMKVFKAGAVYVAHRAAAVAIVDIKSTTTKSSQTTKKTTKKKATKKATKKKATKKATKKKATKKKATKKTGKTIKPEMIVKYVRKNEGCNMTDIEGHTNLPQSSIRRILNAARESGAIRTEGQRRGLRYFMGAQATASATTDGDSTS
jgi:hypothetical protein